jgi:hypothetical protein
MVIPIAVGWGSKFRGAEPAFLLECPRCEEETAWIEVSRDTYVRIEFISIPNGTRHTVVCTECELSTPIDVAELSWQRSLTMARSGVPLEECAGGSIPKKGIAWLEARERDLLTRLRKSVHPLNSERLQLKRAGVPEKALDRLMERNNYRRAQTVVDLVNQSGTKLKVPLASLISKLEPYDQRDVIGGIAEMGDRRHLALLEDIRCDGSRRTTKVLNKAILQLKLGTA